MKATFDLPPELVRQLKLRAVRDGQKLKDAAADVLRAGLAAEARPSAPDSRPRVPKTLPLIKVRPYSTPTEPLTGQALCDFMKDVDLQLEVERYESAFGHQYVDRANR
jgi:plasmid stability protein